MANFPPVKPGGWSDGETLTGAQATVLQSYLVKAPNGDDGSSHAGKMSFGGVKAPHLTLVVNNQSVASSPGSFTFDTDVAGLLQIKVTDTGNDVAITITPEHAMSGDEYEVVLWVSALEDAFQTTITWAAGTGTITHRFPDGDDQPYPGTGRTRWRGRALNFSGGTTANEIWWTCERLG